MYLVHNPHKNTHQCVRQTKRQKPDKILRLHPLKCVVPLVQDLQAVLLFDLRPIMTEVERRRCFCKNKSTPQMIACDLCDEWFHLECLGLNNEAIDGMGDFVCGWCQGQPDVDGNRTWKRPIPVGNRKRARKASDRNDSETPRAKGIAVYGDEMVAAGPRSWAEVRASAQAEGKKINLLEMKRKAKAQRVVNAGGHHVVDEIVLGGVRARRVDQQLVDELDEQGLLDGIESDAESDLEPLEDDD